MEIGQTLFGLKIHALYMLGNFSCFCCHLLTFFKIMFVTNFFKNTIRVPNSLDPDQDRHPILEELPKYIMQYLVMAW